LSGFLGFQAGRPVISKGEGATARFGSLLWIYWQPRSSGHAPALARKKHIALRGSRGFQAGRGFDFGGVVVVAGKGDGAGGFRAESLELPVAI
jgi:hypothetical protein